MDAWAFNPISFVEPLWLVGLALPMAMIALGYPGEADQLPEALAERERAPRQRKALGSIVFGPGWETTPGAFDV